MMYLVGDCKSLCVKKLFRTPEEAIAFLQSCFKALIEHRAFSHTELSIQQKAVKALTWPDLIKPSFAIEKEEWSAFLALAYEHADELARWEKWIIEVGVEDEEPLDEIYEPTRQTW